MSSGRQVLYFCSDIFNMVGFHLCPFHLIFARWLPQIQIPLTIVMNKEKKKKKGVKKSFPLFRGEKVSKTSPRSSITSYWPQLGHLIIPREKAGNISGQEGVTRKASKNHDPSPELGTLLPSTKLSVPSKEKGLNNHWMSHEQ